MTMEEDLRHRQACPRLAVEEAQKEDEEKRRRRRKGEEWPRGEIFVGSETEVEE